MIIVPVGGGSSMDTAKALDLRATNDLPVWDLEYDGPDLAPGRPVVAVPTTAGTGAETNSFAVITDESAGRKGYIGHPSLLPVTTILDPALTLGLPPAATAATGIDAMTHSLESLLSVNPNPFAEAMALGVIRTIGTWLRAGRRRRHGPRGALADAHGLAPGRRRPGQRHGRRPRPRAGPLDRDARPVAHGTALAAVLPEVLRFYLGTRDRELALVGIALGVASAPNGVDRRGRGDRRDRQAAPRRRSAPDPARLASPTRRHRPLFSDTLDDAAIRNSPRLPTAPEAADPGGCLRLTGRCHSSGTTSPIHCLRDSVLHRAPGARL